MKTSITFEKTTAQTEICFLQLENKTNKTIVFRGIFILDWILELCKCWRKD